MKCLSPIIIPVEKERNRYHQIVRCGQCRACRIRRKMAWTGRLMLELQENRNRGIFLTLTYKEDPGLLDYGDFQRFMKRYRKAHGACRFFAVGEYGETSGRGHWHAIIFNQLARSVGSHQLDSWPSGFGS